MLSFDLVNSLSGLVIGLLCLHLGACRATRRIDLGTRFPTDVAAEFDRIIRAKVTSC